MPLRVTTIESCGLYVIEVLRFNQSIVSKLILLENFMNIGFFHNPPYWLYLGRRSLKKWHVQKLSMIPEKPQDLLDI